MKRVVILFLACLCLFVGCDETDTEISVESSAESETTEIPIWGLTEKEIAVIEDIIGKPRDDVAEITCLGYDKMYVNGEWVESKHLIEYKVVFKNGETQLVSINTIMIDE